MQTIVTRNKQEVWAEREIERILTASEDCRWLWIQELRYHVCIPRSGMLLKDIAGVLGVSVQRAHQIFDGAMQKLKRKAN